MNIVSHSKRNCGSSRIIRIIIIVIATHRCRPTVQANSTRPPPPPPPPLLLFITIIIEVSPALGALFDCAVVLVRFAFIVFRLTWPFLHGGRQHFIQIHLQAAIYKAKPLRR